MISLANSNKHLRKILPKIVQIMEEEGTHLSPLYEVNIILISALNEKSKTSWVESKKINENAHHAKGPEYPILLNWYFSLTLFKRFHKIIITFPMFFLCVFVLVFLVEVDSKISEKAPRTAESILKINEKLEDSHDLISRLDVAFNDTCENQWIDNFFLEEVP